MYLIFGAPTSFPPRKNGIGPPFMIPNTERKLVCYAVVECSYINLVETTVSHGVLHACYAVVECSYINLVGAEVDNCKP